MKHTPPPHILYFLCTALLQTLLFRHWLDLVAKNQKEAQKQIPVTNFLINFHLQIYIMLKTVFVCEIWFEPLQVHIMCVNFTHSLLHITKHR